MSGLPVQAFETAIGGALSPSEIACQVRLSGLGRWRIGGPADIVVTPASRASLATTLRAIAASGVPHVVVGDGSNLLFDDAGFRGVVVRIRRAFGGVSFLGDGIVQGGAGAWVPSFVRQTVSAGLSGIVHAIGIPGTLGGLCVMNGGSQRHGIGENVVEIEAMDYAGVIHRLSNAELDFSYRHSRLQDGRMIVLSATLALQKGDPVALRREAIGILASRRAKFPKVRANCGSVFVSDPKLYSLIGPPGMAIEKAGLKGERQGDAQISPDHANFIVNNGEARSADVLTLIRTARDKVATLTGIAMDAEVRHVAPDGTILAAHEAALQFGDAHLAAAEGESL